MIKIYFSLLAIFTSLTLSATKHVITVSNNTFTPSAISTVLVGDTIRWELMEGSHTTTSTSVPSGAATWDFNFSGASFFEYKVEVVGTYVYKCTPHFGAGMIGGFVASNPAGASVTKISKGNTDLKAFPNPFKAKITIPTKNAESIEIFSVLGEKVKTMDVEGQDKISLDLGDLRKGVYFYALKDASGVIETRKIVKSE